MAWITSSNYSLITLKLYQDRNGNFFPGWLNTEGMQTSRQQRAPEKVPYCISWTSTGFSWDMFCKRSLVLDNPLKTSVLHQSQVSVTNYLEQLNLKTLKTESVILLGCTSRTPLALQGGTFQATEFCPHFTLMKGNPWFAKGETGPQHLKLLPVFLPCRLRLAHHLKGSSRGRTI